MNKVCADSENGHYQGKKILLVEDEPLIAMNERLVLERTGFTVVQAFSGSEASELVEKHKIIDLVLMDIDLGAGSIDGTDAAELILQKHDLPIVFLSSHTEPEIVRKTEGITSYGYIVKDSGETVFLASIKMAFRLFEAHESLKLKETEIREIVDNIDSAILRFDNDGVITFFSRGAERIFGYTAEEAIGRRSIDIINPAVDRFGNEHDKLLKAIFADPDKYMIYQNENLCKDGTRLWMTWKNKMVKDDHGKDLYIQSIADDLTVMKKIESDLNESKELFKKIFETFPDAVFVLSADIPAIILNCNPAVTEIFGYSRAEVLGRPVDFLFADEESLREFQNVLFPAVEKDGFLKNFEFRLKRRNSEIFSTEHFVLPVEIEDGKCTGWVSIVRDLKRRASF